MSTSTITILEADPLVANSTPVTAFENTILGTTQKVPASVVVDALGNDAVGSTAYGGMLDLIHTTNTTLTSTLGTTNTLLTTLNTSITTLNTSITTLTKHVAVQNVLMSQLVNNGDDSLYQILNDPTLLNY